MERVVVILMAGGMALAQHPAAVAQQLTGTQAALGTTSKPGDVTGLPPLPKGKSTILGGSIRSVDPVLDRFTLQVYGQKPLKIFYDERTQVFRDGVRIPLRDLNNCEHASVQTTLDDTSVFAISVHILSSQPQGDFSGQVLSYNPGSGELVLGSHGGGQPFKIFVSKDTAFKREGQEATTSAASGSSDLQKGTLVAATFEADKAGQGVAKQITILATPGSRFVFAGNIATLDMHAGMLVIVDPRDDKQYQISFNPNSIAHRSELRSGQHIRVSAQYDGAHYVASEITPY